ncbi:unnamed protein product [Bursaphelenchus okinawaensis]|uniref:BTB domain-containing protein n=1 Tax=Bursaphelenchus okinawaensis TaxID=465554 RepID=A0A811KX33_9BILA|nr:unnamed protein product [Bursaphelenchus okinawaensis]CAG9113621.1 unnamed protein product [Bursaphelenchus okinawaensis]
MNMNMDCGYDDFAYPTRTRRDRVVVNNQIFYVNLGYLAEFSEFFAEHIEDNEIVVDGVDAFEFLELLRVLFNCPKKKSINCSNLLAVVNAACFFGVANVLKRCDEVLQFCLNSLSHTDLMQLTRTISRYDRDNASLSLLVDKIANFNEQELQTLPFSKIPGDVVADVYTVRQLTHERQKRQKRKSFWTTENFCCFF